MSFKNAQRAIWAFFCGFFVFAVLGLLSPDGSLLLKVLTALALLCAGGGIWIYISKGVCPYCKAPLRQGIFFRTICPKCGKSLYSGENNHNHTERKL